MANTTQTLATMTHQQRREEIIYKKMLEVSDLAGELEDMGAFEDGDVTYDDFVIAAKEGRRMQQRAAVESNSEVE